jgi:hypothetical protein
MSYMLLQSVALHFATILTRRTGPVVATFVHDNGPLGPTEEELHQIMDYQFMSRNSVSYI